MAELEYSPREGRGRRTTDQGQLTFASAVNRSVMWLVATLLAIAGSLLGWLCLQQMEQGRVLVKLDERSITNKEYLLSFQVQQQAQDLTTARLNLEVKHLQIIAAQHGWKDTPDAR